MLAVAEPLHVVTHDIPPFGTAKRCCDHCARLCWTGRPGTAKRWTADEVAWRDAPDNCSKPPRRPYLTVVK